MVRAATGKNALVVNFHAKDSAITITNWIVYLGVLQKTVTKNYAKVAYFVVMSLRSLVRLQPLKM